MELSIIPSHDAPGHLAALHAYHGLRHRIFTSENGLARRDLYSAGGLEADIWDLPIFEPVHFLVQHETRAIACGRMTSSQHPTMMEVLYPHFVEGPCPRAAEVWEVQRLGVDPVLPGMQKNYALLLMIVGMQRYAQSIGAKTIMLLTLEQIYEKRLTMMRPMGPAQIFLGAPHIALINDLCEDEIQLMEAALAALKDHV